MAVTGFLVEYYKYLGVCKDSFVGRLFFLQLLFKTVKLTTQTSPSLSLTITLSVVEGCLHLTLIEDLAKLNDIGFQIINN